MNCVILPIMKQTEVEVQRMDIRSLIQFLQIAKEGSYTKAAASLYLAQPTLTKTVQKMEQELGVPLFCKVGQRIQLTDYGCRLEKIATPLVNEFLQIPEWVKDTESISRGTVSISVTPMISSLYLVYDITDFCKLHQSIELKLHECSSDEVIKTVYDGLCDFGLCMDCESIYTSQSFEVLPLFTKEIVALVPNENPLSQRAGLSMEDLRNEKINFFANGHAITHAIYKRCKDAGFSPNVNLSSSNSIFLIKLSESGNGITILPKPYLNAHEYQNVTPLSFIPAFPWKCVLISRKDRYQSYAVRRFQDYVLNSFLQISANKNL